MGNTPFEVRPEPEIDTEGFPLNGQEVQTAVLVDLEQLLERVKALLNEKADLARHYAYPRCKWKIELTITPFWTDEKPIEIQAEGGVEDPEGQAGEPLEVSVEQSEITDPDSLRPEKRVAPEVKEEASADPMTLNPMVKRA